MKVSVIGTGYVGIVSGACLADRGHQVVCVDIDPDKVHAINAGTPPIHEPGLDTLLAKHAGGGLVATTDLRQAVQDSELTLIAVGTPFDGTCIDLSFIRTVARQIGEALREKPGYHVVVVKSTVVPGTTDQVVLPIVEEASGKRAGVDFGIGMNPEFLTEGQAIEDFMSPDRIVVGGIDERSTDVQAALYASFTATPIVRTNTRTAEMIKYASNAMLATAISFANEVGNLCRAVGDIDAAEVFRGVHLSAYLSPRTTADDRVRAPLASFLEPGCGFGGSCLPKDVKALVAHGRALGEPMKLLDAVIEVNLGQPDRLMELLEGHFETLNGRRVTVLGLAFKPDTDDVRETPAAPIVRVLLGQGAHVGIYDPIAGSAAVQMFGHHVRVHESLRDGVTDADALIIVTRWREFEGIPSLLAGVARQPLVVDGRRMLARDSVGRYEGIGYRATDSVQPSAHHTALRLREVGLNAAAVHRT